MLLADYLEMRAEKNGGQPFVTFREQTLNYAEINRRSNQTAHLLREMGIKKGDNVCLLLPNCLEFLYLWFGLAKLGAVMVPINIHLRGDGLKYIINHCQTRWIVVHERLYESFSFVEKDLTAVEQRLWCSSGSQAPDGFQDLALRMAAVSEGSFPKADAAAGDPHAIIYTSGTTGPPKGVVCSQYDYVRPAQLWFDEFIDGRPDDVLWTCLPLFHANAQMWTVSGSLVNARPFVLREGFSASGWLDDIRASGATIFNYIGSIITMLMKQPEREDDRDNPLRWAFGAACPENLWRPFEERFGLKVMEAYGLTETGAIVTSNPKNDIRPGSIGKPISIMEAKLVDMNGNDVPRGRPGEIVCRSTEDYFMFLGYYRQPDKTEEAWSGGWFHTGDQALIDENGYWRFQDRTKDCIRRRGENISSFDIEKIVNSHPGVLESAAVAVPSELGEDDVKIIVVLRKLEELNPAELLEYCEQRMAYFMVPRYVEFIDELPKTATQRIRKFELRKLDNGNAWDREKAGYKLKKT